MHFSRFFIDRPIFAAVLSIVIFVAGAISIPLLPISEYPEVVPPTVVVQATYPGANPKVIASRQVADVKAFFVDAETGSPRTDNILKVAGGVVGVVAVFVLVRVVVR